MLVKVPGPFHAFFLRLRRRKPYNVAITAVARKLTVLVWHMLTKNEDYRYASPELTRTKTNRLHLLATGELAPRRPRRPTSEPAHEAGREAEVDYEHFLRQRFGPDGPPAIDHPNQEPRKKKATQRSRSD